METNIRETITHVAANPLWTEAPFEATRVGEGQSR